MPQTSLQLPENSVPFFTSDKPRREQKSTGSPQSSFILVLLPLCILLKCVHMNSCVQLGPRKCACLQLSRLFSKGVAGSFAASSDLSIENLLLEGSAFGMVTAHLPVTCKETIYQAFIKMKQPKYTWGTQKILN